MEKVYVVSNTRYHEGLPSCAAFSTKKKAQLYLNGIEEVIGTWDEPTIILELEIDTAVRPEVLYTYSCSISTISGEIQLEARCCPTFVKIKPTTGPHCLLGNKELWTSANSPEEASAAAIWAVLQYWETGKIHAGKVPDEIFSPENMSKHSVEYLEKMIESFS